MRLYNFDNVKKERRWLKTILITDSSASSSDSEEHDEDIVTEQDLQDMLKFHVLTKKYQQKYYNNPEVFTISFSIFIFSNLIIFIKPEGI